VEQDRQSGAPPDASDVVEGPVGSAAIKDPATNPGIGADLEELPAAETDGEDSPDPTRAAPER
jgi:hypothetical protein